MLLGSRVVLDKSPMNPFAKVTGSLILGVACTGGLSAAACSSTGGGSGVAAGGGVGGSSAAGGSGAVGAGGGGAIQIDGGGSGGTGGLTGDPKTCAEAKAARTYIGCDFWPTVTANAVWNVFDYAVVVANAGDQPAEVKIERGGSAVGGGTVPPNSLQKFFLPWVTELKGPEANECGVPKPFSSSVQVKNGAYHLTSSVPVTVYQFNALEYKGAGGPPGKNWSSCPGNKPCFTNLGQPVGCFSFSNDASLLLPSTAMTGNYRVASLRGWKQASIPAYFTVTGTEDNTLVKVQVSATGQVAAGGTVSGTGPGGVLAFTIGRGEVVQVMGSPNHDLSGSLVQASKPIQVISGISCVYIPEGKTACDHVEESVFPAETWGKRYFVTAPTGPKGGAVGQMVRLYGNVDNTQLTYKGNKPAGAPSTLGAGQVVDLNVVSGNFEVEGTHEFAVGTFQQGASVVDPGGIGPQQKGDPAQSLATAVEQYRTKYIFLAPDDYDVSYVDIVMPDGASVTIDGSAISATPTPISSGFGVARVKLGPGSGGAHVLESQKPVGIQVIGYGSFTSYQYPGGLNLATIAPPPPPIK